LRHSVDPHYTVSDNNGDTATHIF